MKYRKIPVEIEALEAIPENINAILAWSTEERPITIPTIGYAPREIFIATLEGVMTAREGDFIIKGVKGEVYPCKPDIFALTYEAV